MKNFEWCVYTYKHRIAFEYVARKHIKDEELLEKMLKRRKYHDLDKQLMYQFLDWKTCIDYHVMHEPHHLDNDMDKSFEDLVETVIDFESAPYTKPDKPLNAYDFVHKLVEWELISKERAKDLYEIMHELGIDSSYDITKDANCQEFVNSIGEITEEMILLEIMDYVREINPKEVLEFIREKIEAGDK